MACQFLGFLNHSRKLCTMIVGFLSRLSSIVTNFFIYQKLGTKFFSKNGLPYICLPWPCLLSSPTLSASSPPQSAAGDDDRAALERKSACNWSLWIQFLCIPADFFWILGKLFQNAQQLNPLHARNSSGGSWWGVVVVFSQSFFTSRRGIPVSVFSHHQHQQPLWSGHAHA